MPITKPTFTLPGDPLLTMDAEEIPIEKIGSKEIQSLIDQMFEIARGEREDIEKRVMVGLAAPQIGIRKRVILVDVGIDTQKKEFGELRAYINPKIIWSSPEKEEYKEGCFSVADQVVGIVPRAHSIQIKAYDRHGTQIVAEFSGYTARIFQHEVDHLNGIRFPDRVGREGRLHWVEEGEYEEYRNNWEAWNCQCPWDLWLAVKEGKPYSVPVREKNGVKPLSSQ